MSRKTKIVATIGPKTYSYEKILLLAKEGMNIVRLNMSYNDHLWHKQIINWVKTINRNGKFSLAVMLDTKGPEIRSGDLKQEIELKKGDRFTFTIKRLANYPANTTEVSYDGFIQDVKVKDVILVDSGIMSFEVISKTAEDINCICLDAGTLTSRRHLNIKGKSSRAPTITKKDWKDIDFGIDQKVDFIALSFVKDHTSVEKLQKYLKDRKAPIDVIAKFESLQAIKYMEKIISSADGVMVARGDLGAEIPLEEVPIVQEKIVKTALKYSQPVIVATHLLESMINFPTPTRAEVADISIAVNQKTDCLMLSGETAAGLYPFKSLSVMSKVAKRSEEEIDKQITWDNRINKNEKTEIAKCACILADSINAQALIVFTRRGYMATLISGYRPKTRIFAFTNMTSVRRRLNICWGITPLHTEFSLNPENTIQRVIKQLISREYLKSGHKAVIVTDILAGKKIIDSIQVREIN